MKASLTGILLGLSLFFFACDSTRSYSLQELENNRYNDLNLRLEPNIETYGLEKILEEFALLDTTQLLRQLAANDLELNRASYGLFYLANNYAKVGDMQRFLKYHKIAAEQYLNPLSMLKMAQIYQKGLPQISPSIPTDWERSYTYMLQAMECLSVITLNNRSHILARNTKGFDMFMLEQLDKAAAEGKFDKEKVRAKLKKELPDLLSKLNEMYQLEGFATEE